MLPDTQEMLKNVCRIEIIPALPAEWCPGLTVRGQGVSAVSWEGEEEEEEEEGVSEPRPSAASAASRLFWNSSASAGLWNVSPNLQSPRLQ